MTQPQDSLRSIAQELSRIIDHEESGALVVVIGSSGSSPGKIGAKMLVKPDGQIHGTVGGGVLEARVMADALKALDDGLGPRSRRYELADLGMTCGGEITVYIEPLMAPRRIIIFGAGHVGSAISRQLRLLGCIITIVDDREEWANRERLPEADIIINQPFAAYLQDTPPTHRDHVIIVTRGHEQDQLVLEETIERNPAYLGMIGSRKKARAALRLLAEKGIAEDLIRGVHTPMGLDIGAVTPEEIAVSLAGELILLWRKGNRKDQKTQADSMRKKENKAKPVESEAAPQPPRQPKPVPQE